MTNAWEITADDVANVLRPHGLTLPDAKLHECFDLIEASMVEELILLYTDFDEQAGAAYAEIENQLMDAGIIPQGDKRWPLPKN